MCNYIVYYSKCFFTNDVHASWNKTNKYKVKIKKTWQMIKKYKKYPGTLNLVQKTL